MEIHNFYCTRGCPDHCGCYHHTSESGRKIQQLARRERRVSEREIKVSEIEMKVSEREMKVSEEKDRLANMSKYLEGRNGVISLREFSLERAEADLESKKNELLAPKNWFEQIEEWSENTSKCAQDGSSYGSYGSKPRSNSNGSLQPTRALDSGERLPRRRSSHSDRSMRPLDAPSHTRRSSSASHLNRHDSNQPAIRITPPGIDTHSIPNTWGNRYEY